MMVVQVMMEGSPGWKRKGKDERMVVIVEGKKQGAPVVSMVKEW